MLPDNSMQCLNFNLPFFPGHGRAWQLGIGSAESKQFELACKIFQS